MKRVQANLQVNSEEEDSGDEENSMEEEEEIEEDLTEEEEADEEQLEEEEDEEDEEEEDGIAADKAQAKRKPPNPNISLGGGNKKIVLPKINTAPKNNTKMPNQKVAAATMNGLLKNLQTATNGDKQKAPAKPNGSKVATEAADVKPKRPSTQALVDAAIRGLNERSGSSAIAIKKYILGNFPDLDEQRLLIYIKKYIKKELSSGKLVQTKGVGVGGSFKLSAKATKQKEKLKKQTKKSKKEKEVGQKETSKSKQTDAKDAAATPNTNGVKEKITKTAAKEKGSEAMKTKTPPTTTKAKIVQKMANEDQKLNSAKETTVGKKLTKPKTVPDEAKNTKEQTTKMQQKQGAGKTLDTLGMVTSSKATKKAMPTPATMAAGKKKAGVIKNNDKPATPSVAIGGRTEVAAVASASKASAKGKKK